MHILTSTDRVDVLAGWLVGSSNIPASTTAHLLVGQRQ